MAEARDGKVDPASQGFRAFATDYAAVRLKVGAIGIALVILMVLISYGAGALFDLSRKSIALILVLGLYIVLPVGIVVLAVRKFLKSQPPGPTGKDG